VIALPDTFNAASWFVDRNVAEGRGPKVAIECGDQRITYAEVLEHVNRAGNMLRHQFAGSREMTRAKRSFHGAFFCQPAASRRTAFSRNVS